MDVQISMETTFDDGTRRTHRLGDLSRPYRLTNSEALGLLLSDAKAIISQIQRAILTDQLEEVVAVNRTCSACGSTKPIHDYRTRVFDTAFGRFRHQVPRLKQCKCGVAAGSKCRGELSPVAKIFPDRATPELCRLQTELGSRHSFREAARIMETFLPCAKQINTTVRNRLSRVAQNFIDRKPAQISVDEDAQSPPLTVFLDGAHIRCRPEYQKRHLDVVVGKVESPNMCRRFGLVAQAGPSPSGRSGKTCSRSAGTVSGRSPSSPMENPRCQIWSVLPLMGVCSISWTGGIFRCAFSILKMPSKGFRRRRVFRDFLNYSNAQRKHFDGACGMGNS